MTKPPDPENLVPHFRGFRSFRPLIEREEELSLTSIDPGLRPEEKGRVRRYLHYADTLLKSDDEPPADNEPVREISLLRTRRATDKKVA